MKSEKINKQGQGGGPKTEVGKAKTAQNAITHGVTSQKLLNSEEHQRYEKTVQEFKNAYTYKHPLISLQIERIAQTQIQLERVQKMMHVQYQKSQLNSHIDQDLQDALNFDEETLKVKLIRDIDPHYQNYEYILKIALEIINIKSMEEITHEDILNQLPKFIEYLRVEAKNSNQDLHSYIKTELEQKRRIKSSLATIKVIRPGDQEEIIVPPEDIKDIVYDFSIDDWKHYILIKQVELHKSMGIELKINDYQKLLPLLKEANLPDFEAYDKLMRYQTSLNNQLSKQIGELMELEKRYTK